MKTNKDFDCVKMMRDIRDKIDAELVGMSKQQVLEYFRKKSADYEQKHQYLGMQKQL